VGVTASDMMQEDLGLESEHFRKMLPPIDYLSKGLK
jgi:hypothetical protein